MSLIKTFLREMAASGSVGAGSIASYAGGKKSKNKSKKSGSLFAGGILSRTNESLKVKSRRSVFEAEDFDEMDAESKLKNAEKKSQSKAGCKAFGLQDDDGNTVKIYVKNSDADEFEKELESALNSDKSVAEIVFELNKDFDVIDVEWGEIPEDEEEQIPQAKQDKKVQAEENPENLDDETGDLGDEQSELDDENENQEKPDIGSDDDVKSALSQIIDMLKADVQAKKEEASAKKAEAEAKKAEAIRKAQELKTQNDAEMLDAEEFFKKQREQDKQARQMELLAKYRHAKAQENNDDFDLSTLEASAVKMTNALFESFKGQTRRFVKRDF